jgi:hypothetical protein
VSGDKERYLSWLESRWETYKVAFHGNTEYEDQRTEEVLEMLKGIGELSKRSIDLPEPPPRGKPPWEGGLNGQ